MNTENHNFENQNGEQLAGRLDLPSDGSPTAYILFAHCFTCSTNLTPIRDIVKNLTDERLAVFSFDFTGLGKSEGDFTETNFSTRTADLTAAARYMKKKIEPPQVMVGHSLGGTACLYASREIESVQGVATIAALADPEEMIKLLGDEAERIESEGSAEVSIGGKSFRLTKQFLDDLRSQPPEEWLGDLKKEVLILHSPADNVVFIKNAEKIFTAVNHPKSFISLGEADHLLTERNDSAYAARMIAAWARKFTPAYEGKPIESEEELVARIGTEKYVVDMKAGRHRMQADESQSSGGKGTGPDPYDYLLGALGSCTAMTLRMYADKKKWPLDRVDIKLSHDRIHAEDCEKCETGTGKIDKIVRMIELSGDLSEEQRSKLISIADKCPVSKTLRSETVIETTKKKS